MTAAPDLPLSAAQLGSWLDLQLRPQNPERSCRPTSPFQTDGCPGSPYQFLRILKVTRQARGNHPPDLHFSHPRASAGSNLRTVHTCGSTCVMRRVGPPCVALSRIEWVDARETDPAGTDTALQNRWVS